MSSQFATKCYQPIGRDICKLLKRWWTWSGSNRRPLPCHGSALPAAPQAHLRGHYRLAVDTSIIFADRAQIVNEAARA